MKKTLKRESADITGVQTDKGLTLAEACRRLSISPSTGQNWIKSGRLKPDIQTGNPDKSAALFSEEYIHTFCESLLQEETGILKSRRNKQYLSGHRFYSAYLTPDSPNTVLVHELLHRIKQYSYPLTQDGIGVILADCALQLYRINDAAYRISKENAITRRALATAFLNDESQMNDYRRNYPEIFSISYAYLPGEDLLGLLYLSLRHLGSRKKHGAYYTPAAVAKQLLSTLPEPNVGERLLDPCCGTGNFLLQLAPEWTPEQLYGFDIDETSVFITRINLSLCYPSAPASMFYEQIRCRNFLTEATDPCYHYIIGNPPWGYSYSDEEKQMLRQRFTCAGNRPESYDLFIEKGLQLLVKDGTLSFILPEAILNVKSHKPVRKMLSESCQMPVLTYLGNIFDGVWCPCVIMQLVKTNKKLSLAGTRVCTDSGCFTIRKNRPVSAECLHLAVTDEEYCLLEKIEQLPNAAFLAGNADFAMGVVTGDNNRYLYPAGTVTTIQKETDNPSGTDNPPEMTTTSLQPVLKGSDIEPYSIHSPEHLIDFQPEQFQQCVPLSLYQAPQKLVYRFIATKPVFALDEGRHISLNSCNIILPHIEGLDILYILAILNSRIVQFYMQKKWNSLKVLRSHLERIPIPILPPDGQRYYINTVIHIMRMLANRANHLPLSKTLINRADTNAPAEADASALYHDLDKAIAHLYGLTEADYTLLLKSTTAPAFEKDL